MKDTHERSDSQSEQKGSKPKFHLDIEGTMVDWFEDTITTEQIIELGGWDSNQGAILIDKENNERTLQPNEVIELKPGMGFSKKIKFKRGDHSNRMDEELALLRRFFKDIQHKEVEDIHWYHIPDFPLPAGWSRTSTSVAFCSNISHPGAAPYGIYVTRGLTFDGQSPQNFTEIASPAPPFDGDWSVLSWAPEDGEWRPTADVRTGSNLLNWVLSFNDRFEEGS